jgi:hypothetical protein
MSNRYLAIFGLMDDPLNLLCFVREFHRRKLGKFLLPPVPRPEGGWALISLKESFKLSGSCTLPLNFSGEVYYQVWSSGSQWFVLNPRNEEEVGPFDSAQVALKEAQSLAVAEGLTQINSWPWDQDDIVDYKV